MACKTTWTKTRPRQVSGCTIQNCRIWVETRNWRSTYWVSHLNTTAQTKHCGLNIWAFIPSQRSKITMNCVCWQSTIHRLTTFSGRFELEEKHGLVEKTFLKTLKLTESFENFLLIPKVILTIKSECIDEILSRYERYLLKECKTDDSSQKSFYLSEFIVYNVYLKLVMVNDVQIVLNMFLVSLLNPIKFPKKPTFTLANRTT